MQDLEEIVELHYRADRSIQDLIVALDSRLKCPRKSFKNVGEYLKALRARERLSIISDNIDKFQQIVGSIKPTS